MAEQGEQAVSVELSATGITCELLDGTIRFMGWDELQSVIVKTTDTGPFEEDVWWILVGNHGQVTIPQLASGERELLPRLQALPGFDNDAFIEAMSSVENHQFLCWQREG